MSEEKKDPQSELEAASNNTQTVPQYETVAQANAAKDPWTQNAVVDEKVPDPESKTPVSDTGPVSQDPAWQQNLINRLVFATVNEQRRARRWSIFFKSLLFIYMFALLYLFTNQSEGPELGMGDHTAVIEIQGEIADDAFSSADNVVKSLREAFEDKHTKGIVLRINSPGGSPVQAGYVYDEIVRLKAKHPQIPVYTVVTELCASAAYYIAAASDKIYADKASLVGSIGVLMDGYGFTETIKKLGVERRLLTAGENKAFLDPFSPLKDSHKQHMQQLLDNVHVQFIDAVKKGRGDRLAADNPDLFSGLIWSGEQSLALGLVDGLGSTGYVAREVIGAERIVDFTLHPNYFDQFAEKVEAAAAHTLNSALMSPTLK